MTCERVPGRPSARDRVAMLIAYGLRLRRKARPYVRVFMRCGAVEYLDYPARRCDR